MDFEPNQVLGGGAAGLATTLLTRIFRYNIEAFQPCNAKPMKVGRGFPWNRSVLVHTTKEGEFTMRFIDGELDTRKKNKKKKRKQKKS